MDLAQIWLKFTQTRSSWLRRLQALAKPPLQLAPTHQGLRRHQIPPLPGQHLYLKPPAQQIGRSEHLDLSLDRPMAQQLLQTLTAPRQGLAKALSHLRERSVLLKIWREALGLLHLRPATNDLSHLSATEMTHMLEVKDLLKQGILIQ